MQVRAWRQGLTSLDALRVATIAATAIIIVVVIVVVAITALCCTQYHRDGNLNLS